MHLFLKIPWVISEEPSDFRINRFLGETTTQNLWDSIKAVLRGRFIALQAYLKKREKSNK